MTTEWTLIRRGMWRKGPWQIRKARKGKFVVEHRYWWMDYKFHITTKTFREAGAYTEAVDALDIGELS